MFSHKFKAAIVFLTLPKWKEISWNLTSKNWCIIINGSDFVLGWWFKVFFWFGGLFVWPFLFGFFIDLFSFCTRFWFLLLSSQQLCSPQNVNCRDLEGRHSTPLHFAAGYNRVSVVEYLLHHGADVHAKDKGYISFHDMLCCFLLVWDFYSPLFILLWMQ